jgi:iron complex transport system ATP-binding protein
VSVLRAHAVAGGYGRSEIVHGVDVAVEEGRCVAVLGPNGAGKSTLLRLLAGLLPASRGEVELLGRPLASWRRREVARIVALVPQSVTFTFPLSVKEIVEQGRAPHLGPWRPLGAHDAAAVEAALARVGLAERGDAAVNQLSGGERQRVLLARALASEPRVLLLDEPAAALDIRYQLELVATLEELLGEGVAVVLVLHDWNLALRVADTLLIVEEGRGRASGRPEDVVSEALFAEVFGVEVEIIRSAAGAPIVVPVKVGRER